MYEKTKNKVKIRQNFNLSKLIITQPAKIQKISINFGRIFKIH
jgi:hypothetical protein